MSASRAGITDTSRQLIDAASALLSRHDLNAEQRDGALEVFALTLGLVAHVREYDETTQKDRRESDDECRSLVRLVAGSQINLAGDPRRALGEEKN